MSPYSGISKRCSSSPAFLGCWVEPLGNHSASGRLTGRLDDLLLVQSLCTAHAISTEPKPPRGSTSKVKSC